MTFHIAFCEKIWGNQVPKSECKVLIDVSTKPWKAALGGLERRRLPATTLEQWFSNFFVIPPSPPDQNALF